MNTFLELEFRDASILSNVVFNDFLNAFKLTCGSRLMGGNFMMSADDVCGTESKTADIKARK